MKKLYLIFGQNDSLEEKCAMKVRSLFQKYLPKDYQVFIFDYRVYVSAVLKIVGIPVIRLDRQKEGDNICGNTFLRTQDLKGKWCVKPGFLSAKEIVLNSNSVKWLVADSCASSGSTIGHVIESIRDGGVFCSEVFVGVLSCRALEKLHLVNVNVHYITLFEEGRIIELKDILFPQEEFFLDNKGNINKSSINIADIIGSLPLSNKTVDSLCEGLKLVATK